MLPIKLTEEMLKSRSACQDGVDFVKINNMLGKTLVSAEGDFNSYVNWLTLLPDIVLDDNGNKLSETFPDGEIWTWTYKWLSDTTFQVILNDNIILTAIFSK